MLTTSSVLGTWNITQKLIAFFIPLTSWANETKMVFLTTLSHSHWIWTKETGDAAITMPSRRAWDCGQHSKEEIRVSMRSPDPNLTPPEGDPSPPPPPRPNSSLVKSSLLAQAFLSRLLKPSLKKSWENRLQPGLLSYFDYQDKLSVHITYIKAGNMFHLKYSCLPCISASPAAKCELMECHISRRILYCLC